MIVYKEEQQMFVLQLITRDEGVNDLYYGKFFNSRYEAGDKFFKMNNGRFLIKKRDNFVSFEDYFDSRIIKQVGDDTKIVNSFHFKTFQLRSRLFLYEKGSVI